jgi:predicted enzyme related to lactoylglutathione lyase
MALGRRSDLAGPAASKRTGSPGAPQRARRLLRGAMLAALLGAAAAAPALAASLQLPPIVEPATGEHYAGKVIFVELVTPDLAASKRFYGELFGWSFTDITSGSAEYTEARLDGRPVAGFFHRVVLSGERRQPAWLTFFSVSDVDAAEKTAVEKGAKLLFGPRDFPDRGRQAVLADPQGAVFALLASSSGDPPDVLAEPGEWIWSSLITTDPDTAAAFYQALFGYEVFDLPARRKGAEHLLLASQDYARASANSLPAKEPQSHPHWLNFVRVEDAKKMAAKVVALGGRVVVQARRDRHGGHVALVADPQGAVFGLLEWPETRSNKVGK